MVVEAISSFPSVSRMSARAHPSAAGPLLPRPPRERPEAQPAPALGSSVADQKLRAVDAEVRAHEATHLAALGVAAGGGPSFDYIIGPNGERYAVGGSVHVSVTPVPGDPEATIRKAKALIQGAYAVGMPSAADMQVAAEAYQMEVQAQHELEQQSEEAAGPQAGFGREGGTAAGFGAERPRQHEWFA